MRFNGSWDDAIRSPICFQWEVWRCKLNQPSNQNTINRHYVASNHWGARWLRIDRVITYNTSVIVNQFRFTRLHARFPIGNIVNSIQGNFDTATFYNFNSTRIIIIIQDCLSLKGRPPTNMCIYITLLTLVLYRGLNITKTYLPTKNEVCRSGHSNAWVQTVLHIGTVLAPVTSMLTRRPWYRSVS